MTQQRRFTISIIAVRAAAACTLALLFGAPSMAAAQQTAFESQGHANVSSSLIEQAAARVQQAQGINVNSVPGAGELGISVTGEARVVCIRVSFPASEDGSEPAVTIPADQTARRLLDAFNAQDTTEFFPYESLHNYYYRSSYGALDISCTTVVDYTAAHPRSYYEGKRGELFDEALAGVDDEVDFSQCDANDDGMIDAVYLQFAGDMGEWGSFWWPTELSFSQDSPAAQPTFDGKHLCASVMFAASEDVATSSTVRQTIIHETGHVLGLPDLYPYGASPSSGGVGSFDLMFDNTGDIDGLCKWMLGWIAPEDITYIYVSDAGIDVRRGMGAITHYADAADVDLAAYTQDDAAKTGGFIAVSADRDILDGNLFTSFYLLQYDHPAGNQAFPSPDPAHPLGHGFRIFRVQAGLNAEGTSFAVTNTGGRSNNQLIEILSPYAAGEHDYEYGDFYHEGYVASPTTSPSTNFFETQETGYTGIVLTVTADTGDEGSVRVSWQQRGDDRPLELVPVMGNLVDGADEIQLVPTFRVERNYDSEARALLRVDGATYDAEANVDYTTGNITAILRVDPGIITQTSNIELVFEAGYFSLGQGTSGQERFSDELCLSLDHAVMTTIEKTGFYSASSLDTDCIEHLSDVFALADGSRCFFQGYCSLVDASTGLRLCKLAADGRDCTAIDIDDALVPWGDSGATLTAIPLAGTEVLLHCEPITPEENSAIDLWIDAATGSVLAHHEAPADRSANAMAPICAGDAAAYVVDDAGAYTVRLLCRDGSNIVERTVQLADAAAPGAEPAIGDAGSGYLYVAHGGDGTDGYEGTVALYRASDIAAAAEGAAVTPAHRFGIDNNIDVYDVAVHGGQLYMACYDLEQVGESQMFVNNLRVTDLDGGLKKKVQLDSVRSGLGISAKLYVAENGSVAWICCVKPSTGYGTEMQQVTLISSKDDSTTEFGINTSAIGAWIGNRWLAIGRQVFFGTEEGVPERVRWSLTADIGAQAEPGTDPATPVDPGTSDDPAAPAKPAAAATKAKRRNGALPSTGDTNTFAIASAMLLAVTALLISYKLANRASYKI